MIEMLVELKLREDPGIRLLVLWRARERMAHLRRMQRWAR
jgi:hypothetical protein